METTKQTHKTIGENIDQEALVNSFFEGVAGPIDSGMREMVEEFCQDIIWRTSAIPPRKQALFADEIGKLLKEVPELMTLSDLQSKLIAILDKVDAQVAEVREKAPDELYTQPIVVQKKASSSKSKPKPAKASAPKAQEPLQEAGEHRELAENTSTAIPEEPAHTQEEKAQELIESATPAESNNPVQGDFWETVSPEMISEEEPSDADDILLSMFESDNAAFRENGEVQPVNEAIPPQPTAPKVEEPTAVEQTQQPEAPKKEPAKASSNPLQRDAFTNIRKIRDKIAGTPNPKQSGAVIKIGWAIAKGTITWEPVDKCTTYDELMEFASKIK